MNLGPQDIVLLERWLTDPTFRAWATGDTSDGASYWEDHFGEHPELEELAEIGRMHVVGIPFSPAETHPQKSRAALSRLLTELDRDTPRTGIRRLRPLRIAAAIAAVVAIGTALMVLLPVRGEEAVMLTTGYAAQRTDTLPDGTVVKLNANSSLSYLPGNPRAVTLAGEAFFEVSRQPETGAKFRVLTADLTVTVLGTVFNVNTRDEKTQVYLKEGRVNLEPDREDRPLVEMKPGEVVTYSRTDRVLHESNADRSALRKDSWKDGSLVFSGAPLPEALREIEAVYGGKFEYSAGDLETEVLTGAVPITDLELTLDILREVYSLTIRVEGNRYRVEPTQE